MEVHVMLLLLLLGTTSAQESGQEGLEEQADDAMDLLTEQNCTLKSEEEDLTALTSDCQENYKEILLEPPNLCNDSKTCHYLIVLSPQTFDRAKRTCQCKRGRLVSIHNQHDNCYLTSQVRVQNIGSSAFWIGAQKSCTSKRFRWIDGSCWNYKNWARGEPKRYRRQCVTLNKYNGKWRTSKCNKCRPFICKI